MLSVLSGRQGDSKPAAVLRDYNAFLWTRSRLPKSWGRVHIHSQPGCIITTLKIIVLCIITLKNAETVLVQLIYRCAVYSQLSI